MASDDRAEPRKTIQPSRFRGQDIAARGLAIHTRPFRHDAQADTFQPAAQHFLHFIHIDRRESHF